jgi:hypothetical protein
MEKLGIPAAVVLTEPFLNSGKAMSLAHGFPDYPFVLLPHPINATDYPVLDQWVARILDETVRLLIKK